MVEEAPAPPEGFRISRRLGPFTDHNGPFYYRKGSPDLVEQAFHAQPHHANGMGLVHGGMLTAFLDGVMVAAAIEKLRKGAVTVHLSVDFLSSVKVGDWVIGEARITRATSSLLFIEGRAYVGDRDAIRATGVFKIVEPKT